MECARRDVPSKMAEILFVVNNEKKHVLPFATNDYEQRKKCLRVE
jgi:hypothetical protein